MISEAADDLGRSSASCVCGRCRAWPRGSGAEDIHGSSDIWHLPVTNSYPFPTFFSNKRMRKNSTTAISGVGEDGYCCGEMGPWKRNTAWPRRLAEDDNMSLGSEAGRRTHLSYVNRKSTPLQFFFDQS